jgi:3-oxoacyl-[acyl-carrier protein] reductase
MDGMTLNVRGKIAMVGGASKGLGFGVARALAAEGALVSIASRNQAAIDEAARRLKEETGADVFAAAADLQQPPAIEQWFQATVERFGGVDLLFTNTGGPPAGPVLAFDDDAWRAGFELLVLSVLRLVRLAVPSMQARGGGSILMSTSSSVKEPIANLAMSNVLRASVGALAKTLAIELASSRIRVNQLIPGRIDTDRVRQLDDINAKRAGIAAEEQQKRASSAIPLGRYGTIDEFGRVGAFLLSDAASYITGASVQVDGGLIKGVL